MSIAKVLESIHALLAPKGVEWAVLGAHAANLYREETRNTKDVDVLTSLSVMRMETLAQDLTNAGWSVRYRAENGWLIRASHPNIGQVDVMCVQEEYQGVALSRAEVKPVEGVGDVRFLAVEDILIHKTIASRWQDEEDVVSILKGNPELDEAYMEEWLRRWEIEEQYAVLHARAAAERQRAAAQTASHGPNGCG